jgi:hypothetical protein
MGINLPWPFMSASTAATSLFFLLAKDWQKSMEKKGLQNSLKDYFFK